MKQRIQKLLAAAGVDSRRHIEQMVLDGRVAVNGRVVRKLPIMVDPSVDRVTVDDQPVRLGQMTGKPTTGPRGRLVYVVMNKPKDVVCTNVAQGEQRRAIDLLGPDFPTRVFPVGRLDADSRGLLLLTNDGELANKLTHPSFGVSKTYTAVVDGRVEPEMIEKVREGIWLADPKRGGFKTKPSVVRIIRKLPEKTVLEVTLKEGRNRQVRRVLAKLGHKVRELVRTRFGPLELGRMKPGEFRMLLPREVAQLHEVAEHAEKRAKPPYAKPGGDADRSDRGRSQPNPRRAVSAIPHEKPGQPGQDQPDPPPTNEGAPPRKIIPFE